MIHPEKNCIRQGLNLTLGRWQAIYPCPLTGRRKTTMSHVEDTTTAMVELVLAMEAIGSGHFTAKRAVSLVHALERFEPSPSAALYNEFSASRDQVVRGLIDLFPEAFPWPVIGK